MQKPFSFLLIFMLAGIVFSCKDKTKNQENINRTEVVSEDITPKKATKKDLSSQDIAEIRSVMSRVMTDSQLKKFASYTVTAEMTELLFSDKETFTVFAPSDSAFENISAERKKFYAMPNNKIKLEEMLQSHILNEKLDAAALIQKIAPTGKAKLETLAGITLTATKIGENLFISDGKGGEVKVIKADIVGANGVVFIVDGVLNAN
ncbi:fasciclin domain-containing protein [Aequorivita sp. Q41]|uniref:fasciclin domain-containing protein n=1 Tax=Aequorivita sp. Q41 TaxID=3153300 RepID=UPI003241BD51